jgi:SAM-dependent methyltransferase
MSDSAEYWINRNKQVSRFSWLKTSPIIQWLFSVRVGDEAFLRQQLSDVREPRVLDVACGGGKVQISKAAVRTYGVDIVGFPKEVAENRGYRATEYSPPDFTFVLPERVNVVTCIDLNAHIEFATFKQILLSAIDHLEPDGKLFIVGEFDNNGLGYRLLKRFPQHFRRYVLGMKHWHFAEESEFTSRFESDFPQLILLQRTEVVCIPPLSHFYACFFNKEVKGAMISTLFRAGDIILSLLNNVIRLLPRTNSAFRVGFVYRYRPLK